MKRTSRKLYRSGGQLELPLGNFTPTYSIPVVDPYWERLCRKDNYSLTDSNVDRERDSAVSEYSVSEYPAGEATGVNIYCPAGTAAKKHKYFRCSCKQGNFTKHIHIPGGCIRSPLAQRNADIVRGAFIGGLRSYEEIKLIVRSLPKARK